MLKEEDKEKLVGLMHTIEAGLGRDTVLEVMAAYLNVEGGLQNTVLEELQRTNQTWIDTCQTQAITIKSQNATIDAQRTVIAHLQGLLDTTKKS